jgi:hypothetical protein
MSQDSPIRLRGHTLLCLQGFRGEGYSVAFVENLSGIHGELARQPERLVELRAEPDAVCGACPHHADAGCTLNGPGSEPDMQAQDLEVLSRLGLQVGMNLPWSQVLDRIRARVAGNDLPDICGQCRWLPLGYCREGLDRLRTGSIPTALTPNAEPLLSITSLRGSDRTSS